ncbi:lipase member M isoform X3 [Brassica napus]|nr:lipase member M isoform X3 [Brassica napus]
MHNGVSSFNHFIHELSVDSDTSSLDYSSGEEESDGPPPASPSSQCSRLSWASASAKSERHWSDWITFILWWLILPLRILLWVPQYFLRLFFKRSSRAPASPRRNQHRPRFSKTNSSKYHDVPNRATDRRRGVVEDLHLAIEICIEAIFDFFHRATHLLLSPSEAIAIMLSWFSPSSHRRKEKHGHVSDDETVQTATLGDGDTSLTERPTRLYNTMNTDTRTCQDVITELGYPYEAIRVVTSDGYVLLLERIPRYNLLVTLTGASFPFSCIIEFFTSICRRDARKAVYLQHGILDSSMGWVSNGVVGSPAFAAYDQGYDVFLGNFRGLVSREHVNKNISSKEYWRYSINEHGTEDIPAMIEKIHEIKTSELNLSQPNNTDEDINEEEPYKLCAVCHSLGGAAILMYVITRKIKEKPHRLSRLILLSPAGFHEDSNLGFTLVEYIFLFVSPVLSRLVPAFYIPTRFFRMLLNKLARDFHNYPALGGLVQTLMSYVVGGDSSNWVGVLGLPHYNMNDMPAVSFRVAQHLAQIKHTGKFRMFDYGSRRANVEVYGSPEPLDLGESYRFIDVPVDLVAGKKDKVIRPSMVRKHYRVMREGGVDVSFNEFEYAHLDFTFSHREELLAYVMSRLLLVEPTSVERRQTSQKGMKLKKKKKEGTVVQVA